MAKFFNRVKVSTATTGTGTITLGAAVSNLFCTFAEAGVSNADVVTYVIEEGTDFEIGIGTYTSAGTTLSRTTVRLSKIGGTAGTSKMNLTGAAVVYLSPSKEDLLSISEGQREKLTSSRTYYIRTAPTTITITIASPGVVTWTAHGLTTNAAVVLRTTGTLPTGFVAGTIYYVVGASITTDTFQLSTTPSGTAIDTSGSQSGTHSAQTGSDNNDGLTQTVAGAFLTIQKGVDTVRDKIDAQFNTVVVKCSDGVYNEAVVLYDGVGLMRGQWPESGLCLRGNLADPTQCRIIAGAPNFKLRASTDGWRIEGFQSEGIEGLQAEAKSLAYIGVNVWDNTQDDMSCVYDSVLEFVSNQGTTNRTRGWHIYAQYNATVINGAGGILAIGSAPTYSNAFLRLYDGSTAAFTGYTVDSSMSGTTGKKYDVAYVSTLELGGVTFPGGTSGSTDGTSSTR